MFKNDDIDLTDIQGELEARAKFIATPLDRMVKNKEISSYEIIVNDGDLDGGLGVAARHQPGEVDILGGAVQPDELAPGRADLDVGVLDLLPVVHAGV